MVGALRRDMQNRKGLINGGPNKKREIDEEEVRKSIDRMIYLGSAALGILLGAILALYLTGGI